MTRSASLICSHTRKRQLGVALVVALVFLLVLTILGVTAMQSATLQERMAGNLRDRNVGFQAAEAALRVGEDWLQNQTDGLGRWDLNLHETEVFLVLREDEPALSELDCDDGNMRTVGVDGVERNPCFMIVEYDSFPGIGGMGNPDEACAFRVIAIGTGRSPDARVTLSSTFRRDPC